MLVSTAAKLWFLFGMHAVLFGLYAFVQWSEWYNSIGRDEWLRNRNRLKTPNPRKGQRKS